MFRKQVFFGSLALAIIAASAQAQRPRWVTLSSTPIGLGVTSETLRFRNAVRYRQVRFCVDRRPVFVNNVWIEFDRGSPQRFPVQRTIRAGECSLPGSPRAGNNRMRAVRLTFVRLNSGTRPFVRVEARP